MSGCGVQKLYINGELQDYNVDYIPTYEGGSNVYRIGADNQLSYNNNGLFISHVNVYPTELTTADVAYIDDVWYGIDGETTTHAIIQRNNEFVEDFASNLYIDTTSTGVLGSNQYTLDNTEVLQSTTIAKLGEPITSVTFVANSTLGDCTIYASNDGVTWNEIEQGVKYTFTTSTSDDALSYKIIAEETFTITTPLQININK
jgi:hypothetical protein